MHANLYMTQTQGPFAGAGFLASTVQFFFFFWSYRSLSRTAKRCPELLQSNSHFFALQIALITHKDDITTSNLYQLTWENKNTISILRISILWDLFLILLLQSHIQSAPICSEMLINKRATCSYDLLRVKVIPHSKQWKAELNQNPKQKIITPLLVATINLG